MTMRSLQRPGKVPLPLIPRFWARDDKRPLVRAWFPTDSYTSLVVLSRVGDWKRLHVIESMIRVGPLARWLA